MSQPSRQTLAPPALMYHSISPGASPAFQRYTVDPARFRDQLQWLVDDGWRTVPEVERSAPGSRDVVLTFDDGFADFHSTALPILVDLGLTATLYVTTGYLDGTASWLEHAGEGDRTMLSWAQLTEVAATGIRIGAHTHTHPQLDLLSAADVADEIGRPKVLLEQRLGVPVASFAYPFGYYDRASVRAVRAAGYRHAYAVRDLVLADPDTYVMPRITVTHDTSVQDLARELAVPSGLRDRVESYGRARVSYALRRAGAKKRHVGRG